MLCAKYNTNVKFCVLWWNLLTRGIRFLVRSYQYCKSFENLYTVQQYAHVPLSLPMANSMELNLIELVLINSPVFYASVCACTCVREWESEWERRQCELGADLDWCRANRTIMDTWSPALLSICIWVLCNLPLQRKDATAPPAIYQSMKPIVYYHLVPSPVVQTKVMSERWTNIWLLSWFYVSVFFLFLAFPFESLTSSI